MQPFSLLLLALLLTACKQEDKIVTPNPSLEFGQPTKVEVKGYSGNVMEPFLSRDANILLFNNLNAAPENTNLHWATVINDSTFEYKGEIAGVNTNDLEGVPTIDTDGTIYFVSTRNYATTLSTLYQGTFSQGTVANVRLVGGVSRMQAGWVNFDVEVSADGQTLYFVDAQFDQTGTPTTADIVMARKNGNSFQRLENSSEIMKNINTDALEYAVCISVNQRELSFTRVRVPLSAASVPEILVSTRNAINEPFGIPTKIQTITGFAEATTIAPDQRTLYFHKKENDKFALYKVIKK